MGGRRGLAVKWAAGICGMLFIGGGNVLGVMAHRMAAVTYALGAAMEKIDAMEMWIMSLDTAVRNRDQG